jgi:acyl-CoA synthetase (AMP-forming)/AMP-acid ligase II
LNTGDHVLLVFIPTLSFVISILACFKAGIVGVPAYPPNPSKLDKDLHLFCGIAADCGAKLVLTHDDYLFVKNVSSFSRMFSLKEQISWPNIPWVSVDSILRESKKEVKLGIRREIKRTLHPIAFLQYTSGSTSQPKGVMVSFENVAHNTSIYAQLTGCTEDDVGVSWLPQYHDMGLIG